MSNSGVFFEVPSNNTVRPRGDVNGERTVFELLVEPEFHIGINRSPEEAFHNELLFITAKPRASRINIHFDNGKVHSEIEATTFRFYDNGKIRSWLNLYGAKVTIYIPRSAPPGTEFTRATMTFMTGATIRKPIYVPLTEPFRRLDDDRWGYVSVLTEAELGPEPDLLQ